MRTQKTQEKAGFGSKIGFILAAAGSAVGLGNIWRFPYLAAKYGGGIFLLVYLILAVTFGFALMLTEITIGRRTGKSVMGAYTAMDKRFRPLGWLAGAIPVIIMPYYCVIGGWVLKYLVVFLTGSGKAAADNSSFFSNFIGHSWSPLLFFAIFLLITGSVVMLGVQKGVEKVSKILMPLLLVLIVGIAIYTMTLPGAIQGLEYYIKPDLSAFSIKTVVAAMGQLFYSMSLAMGIMITYGSYMRKEDHIENSVRQIEVFDTVVAFLAGMIIVPAVFVFSGGDSSALNAGPSLMFITLPNVFTNMAGGRLWGALFFLFMTFASFSTVIAVFENIMSFCMDMFGWKRNKAALVNGIIILIASLPCVLGYNVWSNLHLIGGRDVLDSEDFIVSNLLLPIGSLVYLLFCVTKWGWGFDNYLEEANTGKGIKIARRLKPYFQFILPILILFILIQGLL